MKTTGRSLFRVEQGSLEISLPVHYQLLEPAGRIRLPAGGPSSSASTGWG